MVNKSLRSVPNLDYSTVHTILLCNCSRNIFTQVPYHSLYTVVCTCYVGEGYHGSYTYNSLQASSSAQQCCTVSLQVMCSTFYYGLNLPWLVFTHKRPPDREHTQDILVNVWLAKHSKLLHSFPAQAQLVLQQYHMVAAYSTIERQSSVRQVH